MLSFFPSLLFSSSPLLLFTYSLGWGWPQQPPTLLLPRCPTVGWPLSPPLVRTAERKRGESPFILLEARSRCCCHLCRSLSSPLLSRPSAIVVAITRHCGAAAKKSLPPFFPFFAPHRLLVLPPFVALQFCLLPLAVAHRRSLLLRVGN